MSVPPINLKAMMTLHHQAMRYNVQYKMGAKVLPITKSVKDIKAVDCSGWTRYLIFHSTTPALIIPDGSYNQREWAQEHLSRVPYKSTIDNPNELYLAFMNPEGREAGHVWFLREGWTIESHGGVGPAERHWNTPILIKNVDYCFVYPHVWI